MGTRVRFTAIEIQRLCQLRHTNRYTYLQHAVWLWMRISKWYWEHRRDSHLNSLDKIRPWTTPAGDVPSYNRSSKMQHCEKEKPNKYSPEASPSRFSAHEHCTIWCSTAEHCNVRTTLEPLLCKGFESNWTSVLAKYTTESSWPVILQYCILHQAQRGSRIVVWFDWQKRPGLVFWSWTCPVDYQNRTELWCSVWPKALHILVSFISASIPFVRCA